MEISKKVRKLAGKVADAIVENGHYKESQGRTEGRCCIVLNPHVSLFESDGDDLCRAVVHVSGARLEGDWADDAFTVATNFNDAFPTEDVLDVLRAIEVG